MTVQPQVVAEIGQDSDGRMYGPTSSNFHDYANMAVGTVSDHSLATDLRVFTSSPNCLTMYETETTELPSSLPSSCDDNMAELPSLDDFDLKPQFECSSDSLLKLDLYSLNSSLDTVTRGDPVWSPTDCGLSPTNCGLLKMEDVFQVDKRDVIQGPTLAELNSDNSFSMFDDMCMQSDVASDQGGPLMSAWNTTVVKSEPTFSFPCGGGCMVSSAKFTTCTITSPTMQTVDTAAVQDLCKVVPSTYAVTTTMSLVPRGASPQRSEVNTTAACDSSITSPTVTQMSKDSKSSLQQLLSQPMVSPEKIPPVVAAQKGVEPTAGPSQLPYRGTKRSLSPGSASDNSLDRKWEEIKQFIYNDEAPMFNTSSAGGKKIKQEPQDEVAYTPRDNVESQDEGIESDGEEDSEMHGGDNLSDAESIDSQVSLVSSTGMRTKKGRRYFWQYNMQSKGPKGKRLCKVVDTPDPHVLSNFEDPVFDPELSEMQYKHNGRARRGDGNDITPNPQKLFAIGNELKKLNHIINDLTPVSELPVNARSKSRKEKNKLASRACRLKKKAQHEANKVKLLGLDKEHQRLMTVLNGIKTALLEKVENPEKANTEPLTVRLDKLTKKHLTSMIAGHTTEFVNSVLAKVHAGNPTGGIYSF